MQTPEKPIPLTLKARPPAPLKSADIGESHEDFVNRSLRRRLKDVCAKLSREDFDALVGKMTREQLRGEKKSRY